MPSHELFDIAREFKGIDFEVYLRTLRALGDHDRTPDLSRVTARTLVMTGGRDPVFSLEIAQALVTRLQNAELYVMPEATHYAPVEYPELVNARIDAFLSASNGAAD
jgi:pimeloyl-ACP methyl ester carboxylesterase